MVLQHTLYFWSETSKSETLLGDDDCKVFQTGGRIEKYRQSRNDMFWGYRFLVLLLTYFICLGRDQVNEF